MKKRLLSGLLAGGMMAAMVPGVASAAIDVYFPDGACPPTVTGFTLQLMPGSIVDRNGDGFVCVKPASAQASGKAVLIDNKLPLS